MGTPQIGWIPHTKTVVLYEVVTGEAADKARIVARHSPAEGGIASEQQNAVAVDASGVHLRRGDRARNGAKIAVDHDGLGRHHRDQERTHGLAPVVAHPVVIVHAAIATLPSLALSARMGRLVIGASELPTNHSFPPFQGGLGSEKADSGRAGRPVRVARR